MKISNSFFRRSVATTIGMLALHSAASQAARCEYVIQSEWNSGFVAAVRITNDTNAAINGWSVNWNYTDGTTRTGGWNATVSGNNPFTAKGVDWNDRINPGQTVEFGVQGNKGVANKPAQRPAITGAVCSGVTPSSSSVSSSVLSLSSSSIRPSSSSSSSVISSSLNSSGAPIGSSRSHISSSSSSYTNVSSASVSNSSSSLDSNTWPVVHLQVSVTGATVYVDGRTSTDADGDPLTYRIHFGDGAIIDYPHAWHTYSTAGAYNVTVQASDGRVTGANSEVVVVKPSTGNQPPIAMLTAVRERASILAHGTASFDPEATPLTYEWDLGDGASLGSAHASVNDCAAGDTSIRNRTVTLTVSDGELADTRQITAGGRCGVVYDVQPQPQFTYRVEGNQVFVDGRDSTNTTGLSWNFGDGSPAITGVLAAHTYAAAGTYNIELNVSGPSLFTNKISNAVTIGSTPSSASSSQPSSNRSSSSSIPASSSVAPTSSSSSRISSSSSSYRSVSSTSVSNSSSSLRSNTLPVADLQISITGATVHVDARASTDADGDVLTYEIDFGDGKSFANAHAWHSYLAAGNYTITLKVWDGRDSFGSHVSKSQVVNVQPSTGNQAPIAMLTVVREYSSLLAYATASFDPEGTPLTYEWEFAHGPTYIGDASTSYVDCAPGEAMGHTNLVTVTVSDGELKDTRQLVTWADCNSIIDNTPGPAFTYRVEGNQVFVDGRTSDSTTGLSWNFGDGSPVVTGVLASHTYAAAGTYNIELNLIGATVFTNNISKTVTIGSAPGSASSSSSSVPASSHSSTVSRQSSSAPSPTSSSRALISSSSLAQSSIRSSASSSVFDRNSYEAHRAATAPVIDGSVDAVWEQASWAPIDVFWLGTQTNPSAADFTGQYKALWDANYLYLLFDVTDDRVYDHTRDALSDYWEDDTVELFIDENQNRGEHQYNTSAWAYHVSTYGDVVDYTTSGPKLLNDHIDVRLVSLGDKHVWEMRVRIYGENYSDSQVNTPLTLTAGKLMGFSASYIDNDGSVWRESMMGSVDTAGHKNNQGYFDASAFGSLKLVE